MRATACQILLALLVLGGSAVAESSHDGPFKGYGKYRESFRQLCLALREDGRANDLYFLLKPYSERDTDCVACRPFFLSFIGPCKGKEIKEKEKVYGTPTPEPDPEDLEVTPVPTEEGKPSEDVIPTNEEGAVADKADEAVIPLPTPVAKRTPEREPSALVIDRASKLFRDIAENSAINLQTLVAVNKLVFILSDKNLSKQATLDYFETLAAYIQAPLADIESKERNAGSRGHTTGGAEHDKVAPASADTLFEE